MNLGLLPVHGPPVDARGRPRLQPGGDETQPTEGPGQGGRGFVPDSTSGPDVQPEVELGIQERPGRQNDAFAPDNFSRTCSKKKPLRTPLLYPSHSSSFLFFFKGFLYFMKSAKSFWQFSASHLLCNHRIFHKNFRRNNFLRGIH